MDTIAEKLEQIRQDQKKRFEDEMRERIDDYFEIFQWVKERYTKDNVIPDYVICTQVTTTILHNRMFDLMQAELNDIATNIDQLTDVVATWKE